ncbi:winged helix-turn-helix domain-containing protein [Pseudoalteromonas sp. Of11M-6]|uniref:winged helix-turn-helix domain-containing protein n=1 Tax=Pseudoalteromonas sp. Of11M-6 TaxID=2917754 RepID=UPI001EF3F1F2|nr:winged helix-turn-helix domain-containing protein [Pseudoalteromonas sp. Of11M-6]MCG7555651.1 winged helix-turn-helix domain-containing protein [Pseudoalteromonas sp. Of11M-6]
MKLVLGVQAQEVEMVCFGHWQFDLQQDCLTHRQSQETVKLEPQMARLLALFIEHHNEVLEKYWLTEQLWQHAVVEPNSLYQLLTKLRKVLGDDPKNPIYIKTIPKRGYRFIAPLERHEIAPRHTTKPVKVIAKSRIFSLSAVAMAVLCFGAIAFFNQTPTEKTLSRYETSSLSHELGLEFDVDAHQSKDLIAYVKNFTHLIIANKQGFQLNEHRFDSRISFPSWSPDSDKLAFWQYQGSGCQLHVMTAAGQFFHSSQILPCQVGTKPVWKSDKELILTFGQYNAKAAHLYRLESHQMVKLPLALAANEQLKMALRAWQDKTFYLVQDKQGLARLQTLDGTVHLKWSAPVTSVAFDVYHQAVIASQYGSLSRHYRDGDSQAIKETEIGLYTSFSSDNRGDIFAALESFQVNIKDRDDLPLFSSSSIDYLPLTNSLGETAFMSRRSGVCEVYLYRDDKISQLSFHQGHEYVDFLVWSPELSYLASNRDNDLVIYDRKRPLTQFNSQLGQPVKSMGWIDEQTLWAYDGETLNQYSLSGALISSHDSTADFVFYHPERQTWFVIQQNLLLEYETLFESDSEALNKYALSQKQTNQFSNLRIRGNDIYWQSAWSKRDYIWQLTLMPEQNPTLKKVGHLIWHYDIDALGDLLIAKMESVEGDIKKLTRLSKAAN